MNTQKQKIISILETGSWHCTSEFYAQYIADPRTRLCEIKKKGIELESQTCNLHDYHKGGSKMWRLAEKVRNHAEAIKTPLRPQISPNNAILIPIKGIIEDEKVRFFEQASLL